MIAQVQPATPPSFAVLADGSIRRQPAHRLRRLWALVEEIAAHPGHTRAEMAGQYCLSERQLQADLNVISRTMGLPLVRCSGYRFRGQGPTPPVGDALTARDALLLMTLLHQSASHAMPGDGLASLATRLPTLFAPHLRPLAGLVLGTIAERRADPRQRLLGALADALLAGRAVVLHETRRAFALPFARPIVTPGLLLPWRGSWLLVGPCAQRGGKDLVVDLAHVADVTAWEQP